MNMMTRFAQVLMATAEVSPNGAALIGFYGRNATPRGASRVAARRIRRRERTARA